MKKFINIFISILIIVSTTTAQTASSSSEKKIPTLNNHQFPSTSYFRNSFTVTSLQADIGFGSTSTIKIPGIKVGGYEILSFKGRILFFNMSVQYQQRFNPWLALYISFNTAGRVGTDMSTIMADGVNTLSGGDIGWLIRIKRSKKLNLSGTVNVKNLTGSFINVSKYFEDIINNSPNPTVIRRIPAMSVGVGIRGAYAFNPTFGLQFQTEFSYGESFERKKTDGYYSAGVLGDVDFFPKHNVPIGLALGYVLTSTPEIVMNDGGSSSIILAKVGYTGSSDFELGAVYSYYNVKLKSVNEKPFISKIMLSLKFYF